MEDKFAQPTEAPSADRPASQKGRLATAMHGLNARTREIVHEGNQRRVVVEREGREYSLPLTAAAVIGGVAVLAAPGAVLLGTVAALLARVHARVEYKR